MALNKVTLMGRLVADPELRTFGEDTHVTSFRIAVDRDRKNRDGERESDFITITAWRKTCDLVCQYFAKGDTIVVVGRIRTGSHVDAEGNRRYDFGVDAEDVYFGSSKKEGGSTNSAKPAGNQGAYASDDSDLPF